MSADARMMAVFDALEKAGCRPRWAKNGRHIDALCPAHSDHNPSLDIDCGNDGKVLVLCRSNCETGEVLALIGMTWADLNGQSRDHRSKPIVTAEYPYRDQDGRVLYVKERREPKDFRIYRPLPGGGREYSLGDVRRVLFGLPELRADDRKYCYLCEGEKDALRLIALGEPATTWSDGAWTKGSKWRSEYTQQLIDAEIHDVFIVRDRDDPGRRTAAAIKAELERAGLNVVIQESIVDTKGADVSDHLDAGYTIEELLWVEEDDQQEPDNAPILTFRTIKELRAHLKAQGPRKWLIEGIWAAGAYGVLGGEQKTQKTYNALDLVVSVASATSWLGHFPVGVTGPVIVFSGEGGDAAILRAIDAIAESRGLDADELPIIVCARAPHLSSAEQMIEFEAALARYRPVLVILDPLYLAARGAELGDIYKMGALLERAQHLCQRVNASLQVIHHYNRSRDRQGPARMSGAGPAEWGRVLIGVAVVSRYTDRETEETHVTAELSVIGGEVPDRVFRVHRRIRADDPKDLDSPLHYSVSVTIEDEQEATISSLPKASPSAQRINRILAKDRTVALTVKEIGDELAKDGRPLTARTIQKALKEDLGDRVDGLQIDTFGTIAWTLSKDDQ